MPDPTVSPAQYPSRDGCAESAGAGDGPPPPGEGGSTGPGRVRAACLPPPERAHPPLGAYATSDEAGAVAHGWTLVMRRWHAPYLDLDGWWRIMEMPRRRRRHKT